MKKEDTEERDLLPVLKVVFMVLLILCALLLSIFLLVWTARRTKPKQEDLQLSAGNKVEQESTSHGEDDQPEGAELPITEEEPKPTEPPFTGEEPEIFIPEEVEENTDLGMIFVEN